jgi:hypothetical protein
MSMLPYLLFALAFAALLVWYERRSTLEKCSPLIAKWAAKEGVQIIDIAYPYIKRGPYVWRASKMQRVFCVTVPRGNHAVTQIAWLRIGHFLWGLNNLVMDVKFAAD